MMKNQKKTIKEHFKTIGKMLIIPILLLLSSLFISRYIITYLFQFYNIHTITISPIETFVAQMTFGFTLWTLIGIPYITYVFMKYGNYQTYLRKLIIPYIVGIITFITAITYGAKVLLNIMSNYAISEVAYTTANTIQFITMIGFVMLLISQVIFIIPILHRNNIINFNKIKDNKWALILILAIFSALITPSDIFTMMFVFIPLYGATELGLVQCRRERKCLDLE